MRFGATVSVLWLSLGSTGCFMGHPKKQLVLPPPAPVVAKTLPQPQFETPPDIETVVITVDVPPVILPPVEPVKQADIPPPKPLPRRQRTPATPEVEPPTTVTPTPNAPQLTELMTDE